MEREENIRQQIKERSRFDYFAFATSTLFIFGNIVMFAPIRYFTDWHDYIIFGEKYYKKVRFLSFYITGNYVLIFVLFAFQMFRLWYLMRKNLFFFKQGYKSINQMQIISFYFLTFIYLIS